MVYINTRACNAKCLNRDEEIEDFMRWVGKSLKTTSKVCNLLSSNLMSIDPLLKTNIMNTPKCLVRLTKYICGCDLKCFNTLMSGVTYDTSCKAFDLIDLYTDSKYIDCNFLDRKVIGGRFVRKDAQSNIFELRSKIYSEIARLPEPGFNKKSLICNTYELRDACKNDQKCIKDVLTEKRSCNCDEVRFPQHLNLFGDLLLIPKSKNIRIRSKRSLNDQNINLVSIPRISYGNDNQLSYGSKNDFSTRNVSSAYSRQFCAQVSLPVILISLILIFRTNKFNLLTVVGMMAVAGFILINFF